MLCRLRGSLTLLHRHKGRRIVTTNTNTPHNTTQSRHFYTHQFTMMLSKYDEESLLQKIVDYRQLTKQTNKEINRLQRKLSVRRLQRKSGRPCFDVCEEARPLGVIFEDGRGSDGSNGHCLTWSRSATGGPCALDRYKTVDSHACAPSSPVGFVESEEEVKTILSPFTGRLLKPYIRRELEANSPKLQLFRELCKRNGTSSKPSSIDFCYIRPSLLAPINHLARHFFWPGIDGEDTSTPTLRGWPFCKKT